MTLLSLLLLQTSVIRVDAAIELGPVSQFAYGSCIEDVNHEIYGGLYAQTIFGESFEEPVPGANPKGWRAYGGEWVPDGKGVHVSGGPGFKLISKNGGPGDQEIQADVSLSNDFGVNAGFLLRASNVGTGADQFDGYEVSLSAREHRLILGKHEHDFHQLAEASAPVSNGSWHHLRARCSGNHIQVFLDSETKPSIDFVDVTHPLGGSQLGLRTWNSDASFRNVTGNGKPLPFDWSARGTSPRWDPITAPKAGDLWLVNRGYTGSYSQLITHSSQPGKMGVSNSGLNRWGIACREDQTMNGGLAIERSSVPVTVALQNADGSKTYASTTIAPQHSSWRFETFSLTPNTTDPHSRLAIWIDQRGLATIDQVQLFQPASNLFHGLPVRADIAAKMKEAGITFLRYGGTMVNTQNYRWKNMIGPRELRSPYVGHWNSSSSNGFGIFDFLNFCERAKVGRALAINGEETPEDAADLADYLTAEPTTPLGKRRLADGHGAPYEVDYIEIGNEECIASQTHESFSHYCDRFELLAKAIHQRNPNLKLVCSAWWVDGSAEMQRVFRRINGPAAAWDIHLGGDDPNSGDQNEKFLSGIRDRFRAWDPLSKLKVVVFEENGGTHTLSRALGHATNMNAIRRLGDFVPVFCAANCLQPAGQNDNGWDQGQVFFNPDQAWLMPNALSNKLLSNGHEPVRIQVSTSEPLDVFAMKSRDGRHLTFTIVNIENQPITSKLVLQNFAADAGSICSIFGDLNAENSPELNRTPIKVRLILPREALTFPAHSISTVEFSDSNG